MTTLTELFQAGATLPADFLAMRRTALVAAVRGETIPVMPAYPGVYRPMPIPDFSADAKRIRANAHANRTFRYPKKSRRTISPEGSMSRAVATGCIPIGSAVMVMGVPGVVSAFLPPLSDPRDVMPPNTPSTLQGGHVMHHPAIFARYCVTKVKGGKTHYMFPKAATVERDWLHEAA